MRRYFPIPIQFTKINIKDKYVWIIAVLSVLATYFINAHSETVLNGYVFGYELLIVNGFITFLGLLFLKKTNS